MDPVTLRPTTASDLDFVTEAERAAENLPFVTSWPRERHATAIVQDDLAHWIIEHREVGRAGFVILAGLRDANRSIEFRRIVVTAKRRGIGRAVVREVKRRAFGEMEAHRLWLDVKEHNERARRLYRSEGFVEEGVLRECFRGEHGYESLVVMSLVASERRTRPVDSAP